MRRASIASQPQNIPPGLFLARSILVRHTPKRLIAASAPYAAERFFKGVYAKTGALINYISGHEKPVSQPGINYVEITKAEFDSGTRC